MSGCWYMKVIYLRYLISEEQLAKVLFSSICQNWKFNYSKMHVEHHWLVSFLAYLHHHDREPSVLKHANLIKMMLSMLVVTATKNPTIGFTVEIQITETFLASTTSYDFLFRHNSQIQRLAKNSTGRWLKGKGRILIIYCVYSSAARQLF